MINTLTNLESYVIRLIFEKSLSNEEWKRLLHFGLLKARNSEIQVAKRSMLFSFAKMIKYVLLSAPVYRHQRKKHPAEKVSVSFDAFTTDTGSYENAISINTLKVTPLKVLLLLTKAFLFLLLFVLNRRRYPPQILASFFVAYVFFTQIKYSKAKDIHLFGYSYTLEMNFLAAFIKNNSEMICHFHETQNYLDSAAFIESDVLYLPSEISYEYVKNHVHEFPARRYEYRVSNSELSAKRENVLSQYARRRKKKITIGIYGEGYYARSANFVKLETIQTGRRIEAKLLEFLEQYISQNPDKDFVVYPHYAHGVETSEGAAAFYYELIKYNNCRLNPASVSSLESIDQVDVGIVIRSNIFWDRAYRGLYTLLIDPFWRSEFISETPLRKLVLSLESPTFSDEFVSLLNAYDSLNFLKDP